MKSFWNFKATCDLQDAKYPATPLGLITVAAMLPADWEVRLVDCNIETLEDEHLQWADVIMSGGMLPQQPSTLEIIKRAREAGKLIVIGGPDATSSPHVYQSASCLVLGEAEVTLPEWLADFHRGNARPLYSADDRKADVTQTPTPRFDLLKLNKYLFPGVQFARGCPFNCEFCDIIELFGRVPRLKKPQQLLRELDALLALGHRGLVDIVDDNFIGNKRDVKKLLPELIAWQKKNGFPFEFATEASVNLSSDDELLSLMQQANFATVFMGIESPDEETLRQTQKSQNTKRELASSLQKIYSYGMWVSCGYIIGFDGERGSVSQGINDLIDASATPIAMVGLLYALPGTQLTRRLQREGRLFEQFEHVLDDGTGRGDQCTAGINFDPLRPRLEILRDYRNVISSIYAPEAYFDRVQRVATQLNCSQKKLRLSWRHYLRDLKALGRIIFKQGIRSEYRGRFWWTLLSILRTNPKALRYGVNLIAFYLHFGPFSRYLLERIDENIAAEQAKQVVAPVL